MPTKLKIFLILGIIALFFFPAFLSSYGLLVIIMLMVNILLVSSLKVSLNAGQLNLGIPAFMAIGAYSSALLMMRLHFPFLIAFISSGVISGVASLIIGYPSLRLKGVYFLMLTWGFVEVIRAVAIKWISLTGGPQGIPNIPNAGIAGIVFATKISQYYFCLIVTIIILYILFRMEKSRLGLTILSLKQGEELGESVGINTYKYKMVAFWLSSFFAGLTGSLYAHCLNYLTPATFTFKLACMVMIYSFVGGLRIFSGPIIGAIFLCILVEPLRKYSYYEMIFYGSIMIFVVLFLPQGLVSLPDKLPPLWEKLRHVNRKSYSGSPTRE